METTTPTSSDPFAGLSRQDAIDELGRRGVTGSGVYLLDVLPLIEMAWSDGQVQDEERHVIYAFLEDHLETLNGEAAVQVISRAQALRFVQRFLEVRPTAQEFRELRSLLRIIRLSSPDRAGRAKRILHGAMTVGGIASSPSKANSPWDTAEVECMWELEDALSKS